MFLVTCTITIFGVKHTILDWLICESIINWTAIKQQSLQSHKFLFIIKIPKRGYNLRKTEIQKTKQSKTEKDKLTKTKTKQILNKLIEEYIHLLRQIWALDEMDTSNDT